MKIYALRMTLTIVTTLPLAALAADAQRAVSSLKYDNSVEI